MNYEWHTLSSTRPVTADVEMKPAFQLTRGLPKRMQLGLFKKTWICFSILRLDIHSGRFPSGILIKMLSAVFVSPVNAHNFRSLGKYQIRKNSKSYNFIDYKFSLSVLSKNISPSKILWSYVCVTVHHWYNNIISQLDARIIILLIISISSKCFGAIISPIFRSNRLCLQLVV